MAPVDTQSKRRREEQDVRRPKKKIRVKKGDHAQYHSSSEDDSEREDGGVQVASDAPRPQKTAVVQAVPPKPILKRTLPTSAPQPAVAEPEADEEEEDEALALNTALNAAPADDDDDDEDEDDLDDALPDDEPDLEVSGDEDDDDEQDLDSEIDSTTSSTLRNTKKRNDPSAFSASITRILTTKLTTTKRPDPILSRSASASAANASLLNTRLENSARAQLRAERLQLREKGHVVDVLGLETEGVETGKVVEEERLLKKTAQRGVVKLFNAVRAAQVKGEEARRETGVVGMGKREERVGEMSKQGFLDLISRGGKGAAGVEA